MSEQPGQQKSTTLLPLSLLLDTRHTITSTRSVIAKGLSQFPGMRTSASRGQGLEFDDLREYAYGDDTRYIDWNVTARTGKFHTRLYREERERTITVTVDMRPCMFTGTHQLKIISACLAAASTLWQADALGDRCATVVYSNDDIKASRPAAGNNGVLQACRLISTEFKRISTLVSSNQNAGKPTKADIRQDRDLLEMFEWINNSGRHNGVNIVFSGADAMNSNRCDEILSVTGLRASTLLALVLDPAEVYGLPPGNYHALSRGLAFFKTLNSGSSNSLTERLQSSINETTALFDRHNIPWTQTISGTPLTNLTMALQQRQFL